MPTDAVDISDDGGLCKRILTAGDPAEGTPFEGAEVQVHGENWNAADELARSTVAAASAAEATLWQ